jgi:hypothetical protein
MEASMRTALVFLVLLACPAAASAQALLPCERIGGTTRPGIIPATQHEVLADAGGIRRVVLTLQNGVRTNTDFEPTGNGVSVRLVTFPDRQAPGQVRAVFNRAVVEPDGTYLFETWIRGPRDPVPLHNWYRLRCAAAGATK